MPDNKKYSKKVPTRLISKNFEQGVGTRSPVKDKLAKDPPRISPWVVYTILAIVVLSSIVGAYQSIKAGF